MLFRGDTISELIDYLTEKNIYFWHACQFKDFQSYCTLRAVPSRKVLKDEALAFTAFESDQSDANRGLEHLVFGNFSDFGITFELGKGATPNVYGPILLKFNPSILSDTTSISITKMSASDENYDRIESGLSLDQIKNLTRFDHRFNSFYIADYVELSIETPNQRALYSTNLSEIIVDNYNFNRSSLLENTNLVFNQISQLFPNVEIRLRNTDRKYQTLGTVIEREDCNSLSQLKKYLLGTELENWSNSLAPKINTQVRRMNKYYNQGTFTMLGGLRKIRTGTTQ